ncbi:MAG: ABC transporter substrate-binding protein [Deltaproteobacteria bacterium]|nr:ABC transporter substrate-binding protein [Deltaproteobacteria bacterium]
MHRKLFLTIFIAMAVLVLGATVGLAADVPGVTDTEIRIGQWGPQTGPAAAWGSIARGTAMYFKMINDEGGIHGRKIKYFMFDDGYNPARTKAGVKELVEGPGIFAFVGGVGTATGLAVMGYLNERGIPWVSPASGSTHWAFPPQRNLFATYPNYPDEAEIHVEYIVKKMGKKRIAIFYQNDDYGKGGLEGAVKKLKEYGLELVAKVPVEVAERDLKSHVFKLKSAKPDVVLLFVLPTHGVIVLKTAAAMQFKPTWVSSSTLGDAVLMNAVSEGLWAGTIFTSFGELPDSDHPLMVKYRAAYAKYAAKGERWGTFFMAGIGFAEPLVEGLRRAGRDLTREKFITAMESLKGWRGTMARTTFSPTRRQGSREFFFAEALEGGKAKRTSDWISVED